MAIGPDEPLVFKVYAENLPTPRQPWYTIELARLHGTSWCLRVRGSGEPVSIPIVHPMAVALIETFLCVLKDIN